MKDFTIKQTELSHTDISVPELVESIMDDADCVSRYIEKKGSYDYNHVLYLGFCNNSPIAIQRNEWRKNEWGDLKVRYGDAHMIAAMMSASLRKDGLPYIIQAEAAQCTPKNEIGCTELNVYEIINNK